VAPIPAWWLFKTSATSWPLTFWPWKYICPHPCDLDLLTLKVVSKWRPAWWPWPLTVWRRLYLCANFSLPGPLCSRVRPDVRHRQTDVRRQTKASLNASALWGRRHNKRWKPHQNRAINRNTILVRTIHPSNAQCVGLGAWQKTYKHHIFAPTAGARCSISLNFAWR